MMQASLAKAKAAAGGTKSKSSAELAALKAKLSKSETAKKKSDKKAEDAKIALAGSKAKAVAQQAKDAIAEGQTKGQLTVVLGKLKGDKATIGELRKEMVALRKKKAGGKGVALKAKLVEQ